MRRLCAASAILLTAMTAHAAPPHQRITLPNGLVVIAVEDHSSAVAAFHLGVRLGWGTPSPYPRGLAALAQQINQTKAERWLAEGDSALLHGEMQAGAALVLNAEPDYLEARAQATDANIGRALALAGRALFGSDEPTEPDLAQAKATLLAANRPSLQRVVELTYYEFTKALYGRDSSLAGPVWGSDDDLVHVNVGAVSDFASQRVGPNNACLCIVGPRKASSLIEMAREALGSYQPAVQTIEPSVQDPVGRSKVSVSTLAGWRGASIIVGVPVPGYGGRGYLAAQLVYMMLSGPDGRLAEDPRIEETLGLNRVAGRRQEGGPVTLLPPMAGPQPFLAAHVVAQPRQLEAARALLLSHFMAFTESPPSADELARAKKRLVNGSALAQLGHINAAKALNLYELYGVGLEPAWRVQSDVLSLGAQEIMAMAREYFARHAVGVVLPGPDETAGADEEEGQ
ncbi:MAG: insulinase family protein [Armatimonadetes bacterium]|nr:insulinase family protein [Armatimonadota bacterium]